MWRSDWERATPDTNQRFVELAARHSIHVVRGPDESNKYHTPIPLWTGLDETSLGLLGDISDERAITGKYVKYPKIPSLIVYADTAITVDRTHSALATLKNFLTEIEMEKPGPCRPYEFAKIAQSKNLYVNMLLK